MGAPQIILLVVVGISLMLESYLHGQPKTGTYNVFSSILGKFILLSLLTWGGFF